MATCLHISFGSFEQYMCLVWHVIVAAYQLDPEPRHVNIHTFKISSLQGDLMQLIAAQESGRITYVEQLNSISCAKNERLEPLVVFLSLQWATPAAPHMFLVWKWFDNYIDGNKIQFNRMRKVREETWALPWPRLMEMNGIPQSKSPRERNMLNILSYRCLPLSTTRAILDKSQTITKLGFTSVCHSK